MGGVSAGFGGGSLGRCGLGLCRRVVLFMPFFRGRMVRNGLFSRIGNRINSRNNDTF